MILSIGLDVSNVVRTIVHEFKLVEFLDFVEKIAIKWDHG